MHIFNSTFLPIFFLLVILEVKVTFSVIMQSTHYFTFSGFHACSIKDTTLLFAVKCFILSSTQTL